MMAGNFAESKPEYNVMTDIPAAQKVFASGPPIVTSVATKWDWQFSSCVQHRARFSSGPSRGRGISQLRQNALQSPHLGPDYVLYALRPDPGYFDVSPPGNVIVAANGATTFQPNPQGKRYFLKVNPVQAARVGEFGSGWLRSRSKS